jgi:hypothetical protein
MEGKFDFTKPHPPSSASLMMAAIHTNAPFRTDDYDKQVKRFYAMKEEQSAMTNEEPVEEPANPEGWGDFA